MANLDPRTTVATASCPCCGADFPFNVTRTGAKLMATCVDRRCSAQFKISAAVSQELIKAYIANDRQPVTTTLQLRKPTHVPQDKEPNPKPGYPTGNPAPEPARDGSIFDDY